MTGRDRNMELRSGVQDGGSQSGAVSEAQRIHVMSADAVEWLDSQRGDMQGDAGYGHHAYIGDRIIGVFVGERCVDDGLRLSHVNANQDNALFADIALAIGLTSFTKRSGRIGLATTYEAVVGAIYQSQGLNEARWFVNRTLFERKTPPQPVHGGRFTCRACRETFDVPFMPENLRVNCPKCSAPMRDQVRNKPSKAPPNTGGTNVKPSNPESKTLKGEEA